MIIAAIEPLELNFVQKTSKIALLLQQER